MNYEENNCLLRYSGMDLVIKSFKEQHEKILIHVFFLPYSMAADNDF